MPPGHHHRFTIANHPPTRSQSSPLPQNPTGYDPWTHTAETPNHLPWCLYRCSMLTSMLVSQYSVHETVADTVLKAWCLTAWWVSQFRTARTSRDHHGAALLRVDRARSRWWASVAWAWCVCTISGHAVLSDLGSKTASMNSFTIKSIPGDIASSCCNTSSPSLSTKAFLARFTATPLHPTFPAVLVSPQLSSDPGLALLSRRKVTPDL